LKRLPRRQFGDPILRKKTKKLSLELINSGSTQCLIKQMFFTMRRANGAGLAAPQIGKLLRLAVIEIKYHPLLPYITALEAMVIINPTILKVSREMVDDWEGCLSCRNIRGLVSRYKWVIVSYIDQFGASQVKTFEGFHARVLQHEIDHLNGIVFTERMTNMVTLITIQEYKKRIAKKKIMRTGDRVKVVGVKLAKRYSLPDGIIGELISLQPKGQSMESMYGEMIVRFTDETFETFINFGAPRQYSEIGLEKIDL